MTVSKPIDLIVANTMHTIVAQETWFENTLSTIAQNVGHKKPKETAVERKAKHEHTARLLLATIAQDASISLVLSALKAAGAPATLDMMAEGIQAVRDQQE